MATDDYKHDEIERSLEQRTRQRRSGRSRRRRLVFLVGIAVVLLLVLFAPSLLSHSPMGRSLVKKVAADYGIDANVDSVRIGWITPLKVTDLHLSGKEAGSEITIDQIDTGMTIRDLITNGTSNLGEIVVRGLDVRCSVREGRCSLEDDLHALLQPSEDTSSAATTGTIEVHDATLTVSDALTGATWNLGQSNATIDLTAEDIRAKFVGVLNDPASTGGALQGRVQMSMKPVTGAVQTPWQLTLESESLPLSVVSLVRRRFPAETAGMPTDLSGDATGAIQASGLADGTIDAKLQSLHVRNFHATEPLSPDAARTPRVWINKLASFNGNVTLIGDRVIGRGLTAHADFASATLDGAFSRSMTLVGSNDNPMRWLEALDGTARAQVDLAKLDHAMPGLLPLRQETQLISGKAIAEINSLPSQGGRRSKLTVRSDAIRARAHGRAVVLDPIELSATVAEQNGKVRAETFRLTSAFAKAVGQGDMQSGNADFEIDFGRLSAMLRPIVDMSDTSLGGAASGKLSWNASDQNVWALNGNANATNLLITLPNGQSLKRNALQANVNAVGRWGGQSLDELSRAKVSIKSSGLDLGAELTRAVANPSAKTLMPMRINGTGRIATLAELCSPWLPLELHDADGGFQIASQCEVSSEFGRLNKTKITLDNPRVAYGNRWFKQPSLTVDFDGDLAWPSGDLNSRSLTVVGEAVSVAMQGQANANNIDIEVAWRAKLERIQGSVDKRVAWDTNRWNAGIPAQTVGYRTGQAAGSDDSAEWLVRGDCEGNFTIKSNQMVLEIQSDSTGKNIAIVQPPGAAAEYSVGPMPQSSSGFNTFSQPGIAASRVVWAEPNLRIQGLTRYDQKTGQINADAMQLAGDWFATTLSGHVLWSETNGDVVLKGPTRFKMDEVSKRLTSLSGTAIDVRGIHETPLEIHAARDAKGDLAFAVQGNLGWDMGEIAGVQFGAAKVPVRLTETTVEISPSVVPVGQGQVNLAGEVFYRPGPIWLRAQPGTVATNLHLTPEMTNRWLKYLTPLAANAANVDGTMSVELDEAIVVIDTPEQSRVKGRLNIDGAQMTAGPLAAQIISGVDQLKALARSRATKERGTTELLTLPAQTVDFSLDHGIVRHERLFFEIDRAQVVTSGQVAMDSRVDLVAQLPIHESWVGSDLEALAGQPVTLPISGTLSRPSLDPSGIRNLMTKLGTQAAASAVQETAGNYIEKQLSKSLDKIFGR